MASYAEIVSEQQPDRRLSPHVRRRRARLELAHILILLARWSWLLTLLTAGAWGAARLSGVAPVTTWVISAIVLLIASTVILLLDAVQSVFKSWD